MSPSGTPTSRSEDASSGPIIAEQLEVAIGAAPRGDQLNGGGQRHAASAHARGARRRPVRPDRAPHPRRGHPRADAERREPDRAPAARQGSSTRAACGSPRRSATSPSSTASRSSTTSTTVACATSATGRPTSCTSTRSDTRASRATCSPRSASRCRSSGAWPRWPQLLSGPRSREHRGVLPRVRAALDRATSHRSLLGRRARGEAPDPRAAGSGCRALTRTEAPWRPTPRPRHPLAQAAPSTSATNTRVRRASPSMRSSSCTLGSTSDGAAGRPSRTVSWHARSLHM